MPVPFTITPGSEQIRATAQRDGLLDSFAVCFVLISIKGKDHGLVV